MSLHAIDSIERNYNHEYETGFLEGSVACAQSVLDLVRSKLDLASSDLILKREAYLNEDKECFSDVIRVESSFSSARALFSSLNSLLTDLEVLVGHELTEKM